MSFLSFFRISFLYTVPFRPTALTPSQLDAKAAAMLAPCAPSPPLAEALPRFLRCAKGLTGLRGALGYDKGTMK